MQIMKIVFIMGILSFFCGISAAQPQYWGEGAYDLENVVFGMNVDKYYSKARPYDGDYDKSFRYFGKEKVKCKTREGKKAVIQEYSSMLPMNISTVRSFCKRKNCSVSIPTILSFRK